MEIVEIWLNLEKKRNTDYDFPPLHIKLRGRKIKKSLSTLTQACLVAVQLRLISSNQIVFSIVVASQGSK